MIKEFDAIVIGGGAAGMAAALELEKQGLQIAIIEREDHLGGILNQCIHNGFGLMEFKQELTGPEYAEKFENLVKSNKNINLFLGSTVIDILESKEKIKRVIILSREFGAIVIKTKVIVFATGSREKNRGNLGIGGSRPSGVFTAGLAQRYINLLGYIPGTKVIILGSGDIGLIMARRMTWIGAKVLTVIEINPFPSGLPRNISQCLNDFNIPLLLNHTITEIIGKDRIEGVKITPINNGKFDYSKSYVMDCDTLLLSVGLIPENELLKKIKVKLNPDTNGPYISSNLMTEVDGIFACGNTLHIHDIVDFATDEGRRAGAFAVNYLNNKKPEIEYSVQPGANVKYIIPNKFNTEQDTRFFLRSLILKNDAELDINLNDKVIKTIKKSHVHPAEMITFTLKKEELNLNKDESNKLSITIK